MATSLSNIKKWFKTGLFPTEQQFSSTWDSFVHKDDFIPISKIESLNERFDEKADADALTSHMADLTAHGLGNLPMVFKTTIPVAQDYSIQWQTDIVPGEEKTFAQKHGNGIPMIQGVYEQDGLMIAYKPGCSFTYSHNPPMITTLNITEVFTGLITIS